MSDTNQLTNTELVQEVRNKLQLYTDNTLKSDSALPPQNKVVYEAITELKAKLETLSSTLDRKTTLVENPDEVSADNIYKYIHDLKDHVNQIEDTNFTFLSNSIEEEVNRAKKTEINLSDRIDAEKERLDTFLNGEAIEGTAIDTLKEIQKWINTDETGTTELINKVANMSDRVESLESEIVLISCGRSKF